ncbi:MAG: outer membrane beta-barrel protein [Bacteroidales bacterium]|nr:outer membrane beta-barrel protein [Bacteroidales bacterium]
MKKLFASIAALVFAATVTTASAQAIFNGSNEQMRFGIQLGMNVSSFGHDQYGWLAGWNVGATALYNSEDFIPNSYLRGSVLYSRKGGSASEDIFDISKGYKAHDAIYHLHYLEVPVRFGYAYEMNDDLCLMIESGPYFAFRRGASFRAECTNRDVPGVEDNRISGRMHKYYNDLRRFDVGWGVHVGAIYMEKYQVTVGYDWGLCDAVTKKKNYFSGTGKNLNISINLAVYFD